MTPSQRPSAGLDPRALIDRLDAQLAEIGRRQHRFAWLRDARSGDWIVLDAYYPGNRVVVLAGEDRRDVISRCTELCGAHGLFLVTLSAEEMTGEEAQVARHLRARLEIQGWDPRREGASAPSPPPAVVPPPARPPARVGAAEARPPGPSPAPRRRSSECEDVDLPAAVRTRVPAGAWAEAGAEAGAGPGAGAGAGERSTQSEGVGLGLTLVLAVALELLVGGGLIGLGAGQYVLGFAFLLDACARVLGLVVASQATEPDLAWTAVIFGSPALWRLSEATSGDLAPITRITARLAGGALVLGLLIWVL